MHFSRRASTAIDVAKKSMNPPLSSSDANIIASNAKLLRSEPRISRVATLEACVPRISSVSSPLAPVVHVGSASASSLGTSLEEMRVPALDLMTTGK